MSAAPRSRRLPKWVRREVRRFKVCSCADGTLRVEPEWTIGNEDADGTKLPPGFWTRMDVAAEVERALNRCLGVE